MTRVGSLFYRYLAKEFLAKLAISFAILMGVVFLFETIELIRRASGHDSIGFGLVIQLAFYKLPEVGQQILPFTVLFAGIATFRSLSQRQELVCMRAAGLSVWQFSMPLVVLTFIIGLIYITIFHPLFTASLSRYQMLSNLYFGDGVETIQVIDDQLWLRQDDQDGYFILKADDLNVLDWPMRDIKVFFFDKDGHHKHYIDATQGELLPGQWRFQDVILRHSQTEDSQRSHLSIPTHLTQETITNSFADPKTISFWKLPGFIASVKKTGLDLTHVLAHYHTLLAQPLLFIAMIFVAAAVTLKTDRMARLLPIIVTTLVVGFSAFFLDAFLKTLSLNNQLPVILGIWSSPLLIFLSAISFLTRLEDG